MHQDYILQAIESVLMQQTNFNFELIIANDCSPDQTDSVVKNIIINHSKGNLISYYKHPRNLGMYENFLFALEKCRSKYIALCEADDFWTDPLKLQKQVDFLEENLDFEACFSNIKIINSKGETIKDKLINDKRKSDYFHKDLPIWSPTLTRVFRNRDFSKLPNAPGMDTVMLLYQSKFGKIKFIDQVTGTYRLHEKSIYSSMAFAKRKEHIILTDLASMDLIEPSLFSKYFGMIFKKLIELKPETPELFKSNRKLLVQKFKSHSKEIPVTSFIKIIFGFGIISLPIKKSSRLFKLSIKLIDKLLIYNN
jgi:glycosyltransferase involved in cell wall biosynthesis